MKNRNPLFMILAIFMMITAGCRTTHNKSGFAPNIVYILADDLGIGDLGCYGQTIIKTPNIDRLASEGIRFTNHYSGSTVCAPSRSVLMTGQHTGHTPIRNNRPYGAEGQFPMKADAFTVAEMLQQEGYTTGAFGKWGLGFVGTEGDPNAQGFDEFFGYNCQKYAHRYYPAYLWHNDQKVFLEGNDWTQKVTYAPDVIHEKVLEFIDNNKDNPFFLYYPTTIPHAELIVPEDKIFARYEGKFDETPYPGGNTKKDIHEAAYGPGMNIASYCPQDQPKATYAAMVSRLDKQVGEVIQKLKENGLLENTIILFASDNGIHKEGGIQPEDFNSNGIYRGAKRDLYEGGIKTPMIAYWQGKIEPGSDTDHLSAFWDFMPTVADLAGVDSPKNIDGISFLPTLLNQGKQKVHRDLYWEFHPQGGKQAVRKGPWKAIRLNYLKSEKTTIELYNLDNDPSEVFNLADNYPEKIEEMISIMDAEHTTSADFPFEPEK